MRIKEKERPITKRLPDTRTWPLVVPWDFLLG